MVEVFLYNIQVQTNDSIFLDFFQIFAKTTVLVIPEKILILYASFLGFKGMIGIFMERFFEFLLCFQGFLRIFFSSQILHFQKDVFGYFLFLRNTLRNEWHQVH